MSDSLFTPSFSILLQRFFVEHLGRQRAVSPRTITAYRDTFRLLLTFAEAKISKSPAALKLVDLDAKLILSFLDHLEKERKNGARSRNARLAALRSFLKYAAHHDISALHVIEQVLAIPMKRFDRPVLGFCHAKRCRRSSKRRINKPGQGSVIGRCSASCTTPGPASRKSSVYALAMSSLTARRLRICMGRGANNAACHFGRQPQR